MAYWLTPEERQQQAEQIRREDTHWFAVVVFGGFVPAGLALLHGLVKFVKFAWGH